MLYPGWVGTELRTKICFLFLRLFWPGSARMKIFNFLNFFTIFLGTLQPRLGETVPETNFF